MSAAETHEMWSAEVCFAQDASIGAVQLVEHRRDRPLDPAVAADSAQQLAFMFVGCNALESRRCASG